MRIPTFLLLCLSVIACLQGCTQSTVDEKITSTTGEVIEAIRRGNASKFEAMISTLGVLNREAIPHNVAVYRKYILLYYPRQSPPIYITHLYNMNGQMLVRVHIFQDSANVQLKRGDLRLLFGPNSLVPLSKISGYQTMGSDRLDSIDFHPLEFWQHK